MADPIEAHYTPDGDDWTIAVKGRGRTLTGKAPGLIAARDRADQLVEQLTTDESGRKTVVHMLNGDAVEFTTAYLTARLARTEEPAPAEAAAAGPATTQPAEPVQSGQSGRRARPDGQAAQDGTAPTPAKSGESDQGAPAKPTPAPRTESQAAQPAAQPAPAPEEEPTPSGS